MSIKYTSDILSFFALAILYLMAACSGTTNGIQCSCNISRSELLSANLGVCPNPNCLHNVTDHPAAQASQGTSSVTKQKQYKGLSVEASERKFLDATAGKIAQSYHFNWAYKSPCIGDVFKAKDEGYNNTKDHSYGWDYRWGLTPLTSTPLPDIFTEDQWKELREMNKDTNERIHNGVLPTTSDGKPFVILPHSKFTKQREALLKEIAATVNIVFDPDGLIVKDEANLSESSGSEKSSPDKTDK